MNGNATTPEPAVGLFLEQHLGHRTFSDNLVAGLAGERRFGVSFFPVRYEADLGPVESVPLPRSVTGMLRGRREIKEALATGPFDLNVFNSQVPAAIAPRAGRSTTYVVCASETPLQYDQMAEVYEHRVNRNPFIARAKYLWNRHIFQHAARVVCWSTWCRDSVVSDYGVSPDNALVIPPGIDVEKWSPVVTRRPGPLRISFVGGDFERKGGSILLEAVRQLDTPVELNLVTKSYPGGPLSAGVQVFDDIDPNDGRLVDIVRNADVFVLPTRADTFGVAALEAAASGLPVITTDMAGLRDIVVDGETGILTRPGDASAVAAALRRLVEDSDLRRRLGASARSHACRSFDQRQIAMQMADLFLGLLENTSGLRDDPR